MPSLALRVAPQRNTQYQELASAFAGPEVRRSPLGPYLASLEPVRIGDAEYLLADLAADAPVDAVLPTLAATSDAFWVSGLGGDPVAQAWVPVAVQKRAVMPRTLVETRRYQGKTNELFTRLLVNLALFDRDRAGTTNSARLLDPLCGGGTTLFAALERGVSCVGADSVKSVVEGTATFLKTFAGEHGIGCRREEQRHKGRGRDWTFTLKTDPVLKCSLIQSDAASLVDALAHVPGGTKCHAVVGDLPYGIQHPGHVAELVSEVLDVVDATLTGDGVAVLAWNASRVSRDVVEAAVPKGFVVDDTADLAHRVDRVIKRREILLVRRGSGPAPSTTPGLTS